MRNYKLFCELIILSVFVVVIYAKPRKIYMEDNCGESLTLRDPSIRLKLTRYSKYRNNEDCRLHIKAANVSSQETTRIMIVFRDLDIEYSLPALFGNCDDYVELHDGPSYTSPTIQGLKARYCGENKPHGAYMTSGNSLTIRFVSDSWKTDDGFSLLLTPFHTGVCDDSEYRCDRGQCISKYNECDGYMQCGEIQDECKITRQLTWIAGVVVGVLVVVGLSVFCIRRIRMRRQPRSPPPMTLEMAEARPLEPVPLQTKSYPAQPQGYPVQPQGYLAQPQPYPNQTGYIATPDAPPPPYGSVAFPEK